MATFQDLPNEIIIEIIRFFQPAAWRRTPRIALRTLCCLRLTSQRLNFLICPILFETLRLNFQTINFFKTRLDMTRCHEIITALADHSTTVFEQHTRKLVLATYKLRCADSDDSQNSDTVTTATFLSRRLPDIISSLKNLQSIQYRYNTTHDLMQFAIDLIHSLATLPSFEHLDLNCTDGWGWYANMPHSVTLQPLSNLTTFRYTWGQSGTKTFLLEIASLLVRCPNMIELVLQQWNKKSAPLHEILQDIDRLETEWKLERLILRGVVVTPEDVKGHLRHFKNLSFLEILVNDNPEASTIFGQICRTLQENGILLRGVVTDHPGDPGLLRYLSSYSGLKKLCLHMEDARASFETETEVLDQVYTGIIPNHFETLEHLAIGSRGSCIQNGIPKKEHLLELTRCRNLRLLDVHSKIRLDEFRDWCKNDGDVDEYLTSVIEKL